MGHIGGAAGDERDGRANASGRTDVIRVRTAALLRGAALRRRLSAGAVASTVGGVVVLLGAWFSASSGGEAEPDLSAYLAGYGMFLLLVAVAIGAACTAREARPARPAVPFSAQALVSALAALVVTVVSLCTVGVAIWAISGAAAPPPELAAQHWVERVRLAGRITALSVVGGVIGAGLGVVLRRVAVVVPVLVAVVVLDGFAHSRIGWLQPYLVTTNVRGWIDGGTYYFAQPCNACAHVEHGLAFSHSAIFWLAVTATITAAALLVRSWRRA